MQPYVKQALISKHHLIIFTFVNIAPHIAWYTIQLIIAVTFKLSTIIYHSIISSVLELH
jgi:hypothetical protein